MLGGMVQRLAGPEWSIRALDLPVFDLTDSGQVEAVMGEFQPQVIINCAACTDVDGCETEQELAMQVNGVGPGHLARFAAKTGATLVHISTDYVFPGDKKTAYSEDDAVGPCSVYGHTKLAGEQAILASGLKAFYLVRTSWLFGPGGGNFVETILRLAGEREELRVVADQVGTPTYTGDLAKMIFALLGQRDAESTAVPQCPYGIYHFSNEGQCSWHEFSEAIVVLAKEQGLPVKVQTIHPITTAEYPLPATRPGYSVFSKEKIKRVTGMNIPHWRAALAEYIRSR